MYKCILSEKIKKTYKCKLYCKHIYMLGLQINNIWLLIYDVLKKKDKSC